MSCFSYEKKNEKLYLTYIADASEIIDGYTLGIIINNPLIGIANTLFSNDEKGKRFTYDVTGTRNLKELLQKGINEELYVRMLASVALTIGECVQKGLNIGSLVLNEELIFCNEETGFVTFICIPTSGYESTIEDREILQMFTSVVLQGMNVTNATILKLNEYITNSTEFDYADFIYKVKEYFNDNNITMEGIVSEKTIKTAYKEEPEKTKRPEDRKTNAVNLNEMVVHEDSNQKSIHQEAINVVNQGINQGHNVESVNKVIVTSKIEIIKKFFVSLKNKVIEIYRNIKQKLLQKKQQMKQSNQNIGNQEMTNQGISEQNGMIHNCVNQNVSDGEAYVQGAYGVEDAVGETLMLDCVTGETEGLNSICTAQPYIIRVSTGEKIIINQSTFRIGRSRKNTEYCVEGNDTVSKIHAYIMSSGNRYFIVDNESSNHTYINGEKVKPIEHNLLNHMSEIRLGKEEFIFYMY